MTTVAGGCRCGTVRYRIAVAAMPATYACHCTICQRATGSSFAHQMPVFEAALQVEGETVEARIVALSGALSVQRHCARCLSRIYNTNEARPGLAIVRAGTIDGGEMLSPRMHIYTSTRQPWIALPEGVPAWPDAPPAEAWRDWFAQG